MSLRICFSRAQGGSTCHCEPTGPARSGRPDDKLREAIQLISEAGLLGRWRSSQ